MKRLGKPREIKARSLVKAACEWDHYGEMVIVNIVVYVTDLADTG